MKEALNEYGIVLTPYESLETADALIVAVAHDTYRTISEGEIRNLLVDNGVLIDVKGIVDSKLLRQSAIRSWRL